MVNQNEKRALVTGGTSGVGRSLVRKLCAKGYEVHFIGMNVSQARELVQEVESGSKGSAHFIPLDLSRTQEVYDFAQQLKRDWEYLDLLANVAGVVLPRRKETQEGIEMTFAVGYLSTYILSTELAPLLARAAPSRIVNVSGNPSRILKSPLGLPDLQTKEKYSGIRAAVTSVRAKTMLTTLLAEKYREQGIDVNSFHPGLIRSGLTRNFKPPLGWVGAIAQPFLAKHSFTAEYVSSAPEIQGESGYLWFNKKKYELPYTDAMREALLSETQDILSEIIGLGAH